MNEYPLPLRHWDARSWIRSKPVRQEPLEGLPFPERLVPLAAHPKVLERGVKDPILAYRLLTHLKFTTVLELAHVNPVCSELGRGVSRVRMTEGQRNDALRIYCDEGGHALFVELLAKAIEARFGVTSRILGRPEFDARLEAIQEQNYGLVCERLLRHFFVSVSETLVTKILREIPHDPMVAPAVRSVIGDHANDEASHSVYFRWYFNRLWRCLEADERLIVGKILPEFLWAFLGPDESADKKVLQAVGFDDKEATRIWGETHSPDEARAAVCQAAQPNLEIFRKAGVFESAETRDAFIDKGLLARGGEKCETP